MTSPQETDETQLTEETEEEVMDSSQLTELRTGTVSARETDAKTASLQSRIIELNTLISQKDSEISQKDSEVRQKDSELNQKELEFAKKERELQELYATTSQEKEKNDEEISELTTTVDKKDSQIKKNTVEIGELKQQLNASLAEKRLLEEKKIAEESNLRKTIQERVNSISKLQSDILNYKVEIEDYKKKLLEGEKGLSQLGKTIHKKDDLVSKLRSSRVISYTRAFGITRALRSKVRKKENEVRTLLKIAEENQRLRAEFSKIAAGPKGVEFEKKGVLITELRKELDALNEKHINKIAQAKNEIDTLRKDLQLKEKTIEDLKEERKIDFSQVSTGDEKALKGELKKLRSEYNDVKNKSDWLVKLVREETEKSKKLEHELHTLKSKPGAASKAKGVKPEMDKNKEKEYFLKLYQEKLDSVFFNEKKLPTDYKTIKSHYVNLMRQSQMISSLLRDEMNKKSKLQDEVFRLKKEKEHPKH